MTYKIEYKIKSGKEDSNHSRFYHALSAETAVAMFEATCLGGSLTGENTEVKAVYEKTEDSKWKKVDSN
jgi:hypothetical protein